MRPTARIDLNADVGESFGPWPMGEDAALFGIVTSVNVACGIHAGDAVTMERTVRAAHARGVGIGAHPGYPDLAGFGRRSMRVSPAEIELLVIYQIGALEAIARANGVRLTHVKPHGALYNDAARDRALADAIASAVRRCRDLRLVGLAGSELIAAGRGAGIATIAEGFCDRAYGRDGGLRPRSEPGSVIRDTEAAARQAVDIAVRRRVRTSEGDEIAVEADTLCIHGDTPGAAALARAVHAALESAGVRVAAPE